MTKQEYQIVCLLIDRNTEEYEPNYCNGVVRKMNEQNIKQLKQDLQVLIKEEQDALKLINGQGKEIDKLKAELEKRLSCDFVKTAQKHAKIDVLNQLKEKINSAPNGWAYTSYIDEMIEEIE